MRLIEENNNFQQNPNKIDCAEQNERVVVTQSNGRRTLKQKVPPLFQVSGLPLVSNATCEGHVSGYLLISSPALALHEGCLYI